MLYLLVIFSICIIVVSCKGKNSNINDSLSSTSIQIVTTEIQTTIVPTTSVYTESQINDARNVAIEYYKNFTHRLGSLEFKEISGKKVVFKVYDKTNEATRSISLKLKKGKWKVVNEGY